MARVYLLSVYEEHGAEDVRATTDISRLPAMLAEMGYESPRLEKLLATGEIYKNGQNLCIGWGGPQLHVIELE